MMPLKAKLIVLPGLIYCAQLPVWANDFISDNPESEPYQNIPFKQSEEITIDVVLQVGGAFVIVILVAVIGLFIIKKLVIEKQLIGLPEKRVKLVEVKRLTTKLTVYLISVDDAEYVLTQTKESGNLIRHETKPKLDHKIN